MSHKLMSPPRHRYAALFVSASGPSDIFRGVRIVNQFINDETCSFLLLITVPMGLVGRCSLHRARMKRSCADRT